MNERSISPALLHTISTLVIMIGRFRIWRRSLTNYRLILSLIAPVDGRAAFKYLSSQVGGTLFIREARSGREIVVWEIHEQEMLSMIIDGVLDLVRSEELQISDRLMNEIDVAGRYLNIPIYRGRLDDKKRAANRRAMAMRGELYELLKEQDW